MVVTETLVRLLCNTATVHKSRALKLINAVPNILDVVKVIAKAEETRGSYSSFFGYQPKDRI
jgi:hypothetical protein